MFWRFIDTEHPMYDPDQALVYGDAVLTVYQRADALVGRVMDEVLDEDDEIIVMSDHGFQTWTKSVNLNRWLVDNGYLAEKSSVLGAESSVYELFSQGSEFFQWVDWSNSRAYALGLGQIYINLEGRESEGIVSENERSALIDEIVEGLREMRDPETGELMLEGVYRADEIYDGDNMEYAPDIVVGFAPGYRVSWQTTLGVAAEDLVETNLKKWSGDHCSFDRSTCRGVLFSSVPITVDDPNLIDLTPSVLDLLGVEKPARCDGRIIF
jgi:predicted AlkP superfamily phosphohydrolase/phosphomutase